MNNLKQLERPKNHPEEAMTFHGGQENELEDVTKNIKLKTLQPIRNHPSQL
jgi:hypothetical protein